MGWLDKLVKSGIVNPQTGAVEFQNSPEEAGIALASAAAKTAQPGSVSLEGSLAEPRLNEGASMTPGPIAATTPEVPSMVTPPDPTAISYGTPPASPQPSMVKPSFQQASTDANGMPAGNTPGLTRLGKLMQVLQYAAKGGLAGRAASEQAVLQSGGHRGGGIGTGFEAGLTEPAREATMQQGVERGAMENAAQKANLAALPWMRAMQQQKAMADLEEAKGKAKTAPLVNGRNGVYDAGTGKVLPGTGPADKAGTVDQQVFDHLTSTPDPTLGRPLNPAEAKQRMLAMAQDSKPDNTAALKQDFMDSINQIAGEGLITPQAMTSLAGMTAAVKASKTLTPQKKTAALAYLASTPTPASQGSMANLRIEGLGATRGPGMVYDTKSKTLGPVTWEEINRASKEEPGRYVAGNMLQTIGPNGELGYTPAGVAASDGSVPATQGAKVMSQQAQFSEMKVAAQKTRDAINNLDTPLSAGTIARLTMAMRHTDPTIVRQAFDTILGSEQLTPAQMDFVTWIGQLNERAMSLRNVAGMGQGSDQLRVAIQNTLPSVKSGDKKLMLKQLGAFENQVNLLEKGIPKLKNQQSGTPGATSAAPAGNYAPGFSPL